MKYYIIAGEASGDLHASNLMRAIAKLDNSASFRCWGGDKMEAAGGTLVKHYRDLAFMGFVEVIANIRTIFKNLKFCKADILQHQPDVLILVDYPGFNLRIAEWGKKNGFKIIYYISPQVWAWKENRVKAIRQYVDQMLVILPFEADFYKERNYAVQYVGHPLVEVIDTFQPKGNIPVVEKVIAVLPGSRKQEIFIKLPIMLEVSKRFPNYQFIVAKAPGIDADFYTDILKPYANVSVVENQTYELLHVASAAMVTSGTATLETALFGVPEVICYKGNALSYHIAKRLIKIKYICLVNLIMDREVVKELIQDDLIPDHLEKELILLLENQAYINRLKADYAALRTLLAKGGHASSNAAQAIFTFLNTK